MAPTASVRNVPPCTRAILIAVITLSIVFNVLRYNAYLLAESGGSWSSTIIPFLIMIPAQSYLLVWTYLTASLVEGNLWTVIVTVATLFYGGRYLERAWSSKELFKFFAVIAILPNVFVLLLYVLAFVVIKNPSYAFVRIYGTTGLQSGFLVAFKQLLPEHTLSLFRMMEIRVKRLPFIFLVVSALIVPFTSNFISFYSCLGAFYISWLYLRFFKASIPNLAADQALHGDPSDAFAFATFFPDRIQSPIAALADTFWNILVVLHICSPTHTHIESIESSRRSLNIPRQEAERRRALALKALDQRLSASGGRSASAASTTTSKEPAPNSPHPDQSQATESSL